MDGNTLLVIGLAATLVLWAVTWLRQAQVRGLALRGAAIALAVALALGLIVFGAAELFLGETLATGLVAGATVGLGYLWLNLIILSVGLWFKPAESWAVGSALSTPVILAAIGFGYAAYRAWPLQ